MQRIVNMLLFLIFQLFMVNSHLSASTNSSDVGDNALVNKSIRVKTGCFNTEIDNIKSMDICGGKLVTVGDQRAKIEHYRKTGKLTAYDGEGFLETSYSGGKTTVVARPFVLVFEDDFNGTELDSNKWQNSHWAQKGFRFSDNTYVNDGKLILKTILKDADGDGDNEYTSGTISSKFCQQFGFWKASYKICKAPGVNNAFWLNTPEFGPDAENPAFPFKTHTARFEIDIQECHYPDELNMGVHDWRPKHKKFLKEKMSVPHNLADSFHEYGFRWKENNDVEWSFDDEIVFTGSVSKGNSHQSTVEILFSTIVADWVGKPDEKTDSSQMEVDWVRAYEWPMYWTTGSYRFPKVTIESTNRGPSFTKKFVILNDTESAVNFTGVKAEIAGNNTDQFRCKLADDTSIPAGHYRLVEVTFSPTSIGKKSALLKIYTDYPGSSTTTINLTGPAITAVATNPSPANGAIVYDRNIDLAWQSGFFAKDHKIYFGTDQNSVAAATTSSSEYKGSEIACSYDSGLSDYNTTYYWAVDEMDFYSNHPRTDQNYDITVEGKVWSFTGGVRYICR